MALQSVRVTANGVAVKGTTRVDVGFVTFTAAAGDASTLTIRENTSAGRIRWQGTVQAGTTQHFAFPALIGISQSVYVSADHWGSAIIGY